MNGLELYKEKIFEDIKHIDEFGVEYWEARELMKVLKYTKWENFNKVIEKAKEACKKSNNVLEYHFPEVRKMVQIGSNTKRLLEDYKLSRYACYLIVQNGDARKKEIALGQTYFAIQTRKMELLQENQKAYENMSEDEKRKFKRKKIKTGNYELNRTARNIGVKNYDKFTNAGYKGLYNGETANDIARRKGLRYREEILDNMCSEELIANEFRIALINQKLKNEGIMGEANASNAHFMVGEKVRNVIKEVGGTLPEDFNS
ncbi:MAG: DNA damage-inducible protein D [Ruminococcus sp.]|nr:DNA damage-inducible protein D [Ruminococcus sp.]